MNSLLLILLSIFNISSDRNIYTNTPYAFSISVPSQAKLDSSFNVIETDSIKIVRFKIIFKEDKQNYLFKGIVTYRIIAEGFISKHNTPLPLFYNQCKNEILNAQEQDCNNTIITSKEILEKKEKTEVLYTIEFSNNTLIEYRKVVIIKDRAITISYLTVPLFYNETEKNEFFNSLDIKPIIEK